VAAPGRQTDAAALPAAEAVAGTQASAGGGDERHAVLVGYGVKLGRTTRRARKTSPVAATSAHALAPGQAVASPAQAPASAATPAPANGADHAAGTGGTAGTRPLAKPPVRKLARDLGVDLGGLTGSGPQGSITRDDVQQAVGAPGRGLAEGGPADGGLAGAGLAGAGLTGAGLTGAGLAGAGLTGTGLTGAGLAGAGLTGTGLRGAGLAAVPREERVPVRGVRKYTAAAVTASAFTAPHVTEFLQLDVTGATEALGRIRELPEFAGLRVSPLLLAARALIVAIARHPMINSSWDEEAQEIVVHHYVNLGIAAATERGLVVPNIKDAHALPLPELARALSQLAETARAGKTSPADLAHGTITITNVGVFGVDTGTPILTPGEAAILALGQIKDAPWVHEGQLAVRKVTTLALSFDHRIVDGDLGSIVLSEVGAMLADPLRMLAWG
jgi:pyruvate dehydrogenase E2 component (dihydrolipoamide acetyltransferase)